MADEKKLMNPEFIRDAVLKMRRQFEQNLGKGTLSQGLIDVTSKKTLTALDMLWEGGFKKILEEAVPGVPVYGEESLSTGLDLSQIDKTCVLLDMMDGTDLYDRGFENWCSAIVVFNPKHGLIQAAYVLLTDETMYYATAAEAGAFKASLSTEDFAPERIRVEGRVPIGLRDAAVCMYGQKGNAVSTLISLGQEKPKFAEFIKGLSSQRSDRGFEAKFRFYNFAGNPMMARVPDGAVNVVFELNGQYPHDVVPGAFIALKAGAFLGHGKKREAILPEGLAKHLRQPADQKISYILAESEGLYNELLDLIM